MSAVTAVARRSPGSTIASTLLVIVLIGTASGFVGFGITGARRTASAFSRFVAWSDPPAVVTGSVPESIGPVRDRLPEIEALPIVADHARYESVLVDSVEFTPGRPVHAPRIIVVAQVASSMGWSRGRVKVLDGALPSITSVDQAVVDFPTAHAFDLHVGDLFRLNMSDGSRVSIRLGAVVSEPGSFPTVAGFAFSNLVLPSGFAAAHPDWTDPWESGDQLWLSGGDDDLEALQRSLRGIGLDRIDLTPMSVTEIGANKVVRLESLGLWLAAAVAALAGVTVIAQLQRRHRSRGASDLRVLRALGLSRTQTVVCIGLRDVATGLAGAALGALIALVLSPLTPLGLARKVEIDPGFRFDSTASIITAVGTVVIVTVTGLVATLLQLRSGASRVSVRPTSRVARALTEPMATGWRFAFGSRRRVAPGLIPAAITLAMLIGVVATVQQVAALPDHPELTGGAWDALMSVDHTDRASGLVAEVSSAPGVVAVARGGWTSLQLDGIDVNVQVLEPGAGVEPTVVTGRAPITDDEIALGAGVLRELHLGIGSDVAFDRQGDTPHSGRFHIVGEVISNSSLFQTVLPDHGGLIADTAFDKFGDVRPLPVLVKFDDRIAPETGLDNALAALPPDAVSFAFARSGRGDVLALRSMIGLPWLLVVFLALMTVASIAQWSITSSRRQRHDNAVLRALGWTKRQVRSALIVAGGLVAFAAAVIGVPAGIVVGRWSWRALADFLVVSPRLRTPGAVCAISLIGVGLTGVALAAVAGRRQKVHPAADLRIE